MPTKNRPQSSHGRYKYSCPHRCHCQPNKRKDQVRATNHSSQRCIDPKVLSLLSVIRGVTLPISLKMNLSLYSIQAFVVLDTEGNRVLAKYYRPKSHPQGESKELLTLKEQKVFEKGLWQKTKKPGGACLVVTLIECKLN